MIESKVMTKEQAANLGYVRIVDYERTMRYLSVNKALVDFSTTELKPCKEMFDYKSVILSNVAFIIRIALYHVLLVCLSNLPGTLVIFFISIELSYLALILKNFTALKNLISWHLLASKILQAFFLLAFHLISGLFLVRQMNNSANYPSMGEQKMAMWCLLIIIAFEYIFLVFNIVWIIRMVCQKKKK
jgi:hypothetical protein